jgi:hypothetical protein
VHFFSLPLKWTILLIYRFIHSFKLFASNMAARLRMPTLAFAALSICLNIAIIGCAGRTVNIFYVQQKSNAWLLPIWPNHFDTRELQALLGTSAAIVLLNALLILALFIISVS